MFLRSQNILEAQPVKTFRNHAATHEISSAGWIYVDAYWIDGWIRRVYVSVKIRL